MAVLKPQRLEVGGYLLHRLVIDLGELAVVGIGEMCLLVLPRGEEVPDGGLMNFLCAHHAGGVLQGLDTSSGST